MLAILAFAAVLLVWAFGGTLYNLLLLLQSGGLSAFESR